MRLRLAVLGAVISAFLSVGVAGAAPGDLDSSFGGGDGVVVTDFGDQDFAYAGALQADSNIVAAGIHSDASGSNGDVALARYLGDPIAVTPGERVDKLIPDVTALPLDEGSATACS